MRGAVKARETPPATQAPADPPLFRGVLGGGCARPGKANLRLIRRAIREGWDMPEEKRRALVEHLLGVVRSGHPRNAIAAAWCLIEADRVNLAEEQQERNRLAVEARQPEEPAERPPGHQGTGR